MEFSIQERIELIINLYTPPNGYLAENIDEFPEGKRFAKAGYMYLDTECNIYYANSQGHDFLHDTIKQISEDMISFVKKKGWTISRETVFQWFKDTYKLLDDFTRDCIVRYIFDNLATYGYKIYYSNQREKYVLEKV